MTIKQGDLVRQTEDEYSCGGCVWIATPPPKHSRSQWTMVKIECRCGQSDCSEWSPSWNADATNLESYAHLFEILRTDSEGGYIWEKLAP